MKFLYFVRIYEASSVETAQWLEKRSVKREVRLTVRFNVK